jgi:hypothetical protein
MGLGVSIRIAPGVRVYASSRGLRTRARRGGVRVSSGARSHRATRSRADVTVSLAELRRQDAAAQHAEAIAAVARLEQVLLTLHHEDFVPASRDVLSPPTRPDLKALTEARAQQALTGVSLFDRSKRAAAHAWAEDAGRRDAATQWSTRQSERAHHQSELDQHWTALVNHDDDTVREALESAFDGPDSQATCIDVGTENGTSYATILALVGAADLVPEQRLAQTATGQTTLHKRTMTERNDLYLGAVGSAVLATAKEGFAVAPSVTEMRIAVLRKNPHAPTPDQYVECVYVGRFPRRWTAALRWRTLDPGETLLTVPDARLQRHGAAAEVVGLPLDAEPGLTEIVNYVRAAL